MKKRIGNDIHFVWHIYRKDGDTQVPESFTGKEVEVRLISPLQRPVTIENVSIATGVVTFTFRGKHQTTLGNYVAVLLENKGEDGMVTLDVVNAVTLVPHSYMEEDGDDGDVIEAESVELTSTISAAGGGGFVQQQSDWAQTDDTAVDYIKNKPNLDVYCRKDADNTHSDGVRDIFAKLVYDEHNPSVLIQADRLTVGGDSIKFYHSHRGEDTKELSLQIDDVEKLKDLPTGEELTEELAGKQDTIDDLDAIRSGAQAGATAYQKPVTGIPATDLASAVQVSLGKADTALQEHQSLAGLVNTGSYNTVSKKIELKHDNTILAEIDATAFIKDGMVSSVTISNGYLVITFNTDAGKEPISIALTDIFNPANYYDKDDVDGLLAGKVDKESGKGLSANDYTTADKDKLNTLPTNSELTTLLNGKADVGRVEDIEDALSVVESETADATDYTTETTSVSTDNITINPVAVRKSPIYSVYKQGGGQESIEGVFSPGYTDGSYILNVQIAQAGTVKIDSIRTRYYSGYFPIVYFYFTPTGGEKVKVAEIAKASAGTPIGYKYEEPTVSINAPGAGVLSIELWLYDIDTYNTIPAFFWMEYERSSVVYYAITSISFEQSSLTGFVNNGAYNSTTKKIELKHDSDILAEIDATDIFDSDNYYDKNDVNGLLAGKANTADLAEVATTGSYNDLSDKPTIPDITGKADKVSNATNGNFAALDSNGNLIDSGHKHSDYLTQHQDLTNYVQKSQTAGLLKNDGTVDTTQYTTNTGTITGITMNGQSKGTSGNVDLGTVVTDVSGKEDITPIEAVASGTTAITAQVNKYYEVAGTVSSLTVTLPTPTANTEVTMVVAHLTVGASPMVVVTSVNEVVKFSAAYSVVANKEYELSCLYNGSKWIVSSMEVAV